jgi:hypothetical protein
MGDASNVLVGSAALYVAPYGTDLPDFEAVDFEIPAEWTAVGFTDDGTELGFSVTVKDIKVDEQRAPIQKIIDEEKGTISAKLAESTLQNLYDAIATATLEAAVPAGPTSVGYQRVTLGGGDLKYVSVMLIGNAPGNGLKRVIIGYKAISQANVTMAFKRTDKTVMNVEFGLIADTTRQDGDNLAGVWNITAEHTT